MVNLDEFKYGGTNLTAFRLLDPEREEVKQVVQDWIFGELRYGRKLEPHEQTIKVRILLSKSCKESLSTCAAITSKSPPKNV